MAGRASSLRPSAAPYFGAVGAARTRDCIGPSPPPSCTRCIGPSACRRARTRRIGPSPPSCTRLIGPSPPPSCTRCNDPAALARGANKRPPAAHRGHDLARHANESSLGRVGQAVWLAVCTTCTKPASTGRDQGPIVERVHVVQGRLGSERQAPTRAVTDRSHTRTIEFPPGSTRAARSSSARRPSIGKLGPSAAAPAATNSRDRRVRGSTRMTPSTEPSRTLRFNRRTRAWLSCGLVSASTPYRHSDPREIMASHARWSPGPGSGTSVPQRSPG